MGARRLGILGGTFDPVHHGHLLLALHAREQLACRDILLIPNAHSPFKASGPKASFNDRMAMIHLAIEGTRGLACSDIEGKRGGVSYMIDTLHELRALHSQAEFVLILGGDAYCDLPSWRDSADIRTLARIAVVARGGESPALASSTDEVIQMPRFDISASDIRARVRAGRLIDFLTPAPVAKYIIDHGLYRTT
ncbi:MAG: nicotinate-nucleotide adenylyltransferase [Candidatus Zixiibacteriota bacterium]